MHGCVRTRAQAQHYYDTRRPLQDYTRIIYFSLKFLDGAWNRYTSEVAWKLFHGRNPYLTVPCAIGNF